MDKVYAISSDGTKDGLTLIQVAKDTEGIIKILTSHLKEIGESFDKLVDYLMCHPSELSLN